MTVGQSYSEWLGDETNYEDTLPHWRNLDWERGELIDMIDVYDVIYTVTTDYNGNIYEGTGLYSCGELVEVEEIERKK